MKKQFLLLILTAFICPLSFHAQVPNFHSVISWSTVVGGGEGKYVATDAAGNSYLGGLLSYTIDADPGPGFYRLPLNINTLANADPFVIKLDAGGNFVWAINVTNTSAWENITSLNVDASGNVYLTGIFKDTIDFDPGVGTYTLGSTSIRDSYILKLDPLGNFAWARQIKGDTRSDIYSATIDATGNLYIAGQVVGTTDFDPGPGTHTISFGTAGGGGFVSKLSPAGNLIWAKAYVGIWSNSASCNGVTLDGNGNVYTTGYYYGNVDFDPGPGTFYYNNPTFFTEAFLSKLDNAGNFVWAKQFGGKDHDLGSVLDVDPFGNLIVAGQIKDTADLDPGVGITNLTVTPNNADFFVSKFNPAGNLIWAKQFASKNTGPTFKNVFTLKHDALGDIFIGGNYSDTIDFNPGIGVNNLTAYATTNGFITKLDVNGNFSWAVQIGSSPGPDDLASLYINSTGDVFSTGYFSNSVDFDPGPGSTILNAPMPNTFFYLWKLSGGVLTEVAQISEGESYVKAYPNPFNDQLKIEVSLKEFNNNTKIELIDVTGRVVRSEHAPASKFEIVTDDLNSGVYLLRITNADKGEKIQKVIKL